MNEASLFQSTTKHTLKNQTVRGDEMRREFIGRVGDRIISYRGFSLHRNNKGKIVNWWLKQYLPSDRVVFKEITPRRIKLNEHEPEIAAVCFCGAIVLCLLLLFVL